MDYNPKQTSYSEFIKSYIEKQYMQIIITSAKMVNILQIVHQYEGLIKYIKLSNDIYDDGKEQVEIDNRVLQINEKMKENEKIDIANFLYHSDEDSIDIHSIKCKLNGVYFTVLANGIIIYEKTEDKITIKKILESSLLS